MRMQPIFLFLRYSLEKSIVKLGRCMVWLFSLETGLGTRIHFKGWITRGKPPPLVNDAGPSDV